jgi:hypothetical protein
MSPPRLHVADGLVGMMRPHGLLLVDHADSVGCTDGAIGFCYGGTRAEVRADVVGPKCGYKVNFAFAAGSRLPPFPPYAGLAIHDPTGKTEVGAYVPNLTDETYASYNIYAVGAAQGGLPACHGEWHTTMKVPTKAVGQRIKI